MLINHQDENGIFIGIFQKNEIVILKSANPKKRWRIIRYFGWRSGYACYGYQIQDIANKKDIINVTEVDLEKI